MTRKECEGCAYYGFEYGVFSSGPRVCDYCFLTDKHRPCPAGAGCTVRLEKLGNRGRGKPSRAKTYKPTLDIRIPKARVRKFNARREYITTFLDSPEQVKACLNCNVPADYCGGQCSGGRIIPLTKPNLGARK